MSNAKGDAPNVLVVDDDAALRLTTEAILSGDFNVTTASNIEEGKAALAEREFDVVLTDYEMPGGSGLLLARTVAESFPAVMVILLTGHPEIAEVHESERADRLRVLAKPVDPARLIESVTNAVKLAKVRRATGRLRLPRTADAGALKVAFPRASGAEEFVSSLSATGCLLRTPRDLKIGEAIELVVSFATPPSEFRVTARVRSCTGTGPRRALGLVFINVSQAAREQLEKSLYGTQTPLSGLALRVVFVETSPALKTIYQQTLEDLVSSGQVGVSRLDLSWASNGEEALGMIRHRRADAVIVDVDQLVVEPRTWLGRVRSRPANETLPVVALTRGVDDFGAEDPRTVTIRKPVALDRLARVLAGLLSGPSSSVPPAAKR